MNPRDTETVFRYHLVTKHHVHRYARSLGYMDWANQPDPFRRFHGAPLIQLPLQEQDTSPPYEDLMAPGSVSPHPLTVESLGALLEHSLALSAWKAFQGSRWALRCNPSSGNLHPTEGYVLAPAVPNFAASPGVYHYAPAEHGLELRQKIDDDMWQGLVGEDSVESLLVGLTSIHWREAWKYGERAFRYCQLDAGHAIAALALSAATLGWQTHVLDRLGGDTVAALLGLNEQSGVHPDEREVPECVLAISPRHGHVPVDPVTAAAVCAGTWSGTANVLSADHVRWDIVEDVSAATAKPETAGEPYTPLPDLPLHHHSTHRTAWAIMKQRRSAVAMDGKTSIGSAAFFSMLARTMPSAAPPWHAWPYYPRVHLAIFVHRVDGFEPGLYLLARAPETADALRASFRSDFLWKQPRDCPNGLTLALLVPGDCRRVATHVSCTQDIAGDGAFSLGMIAEFEEPIVECGPWMYRRLFWECGMIGQVLYLAAEAAGVRATGIGCYFDDTMHEILGLRGRRFQSLYHFTVGGPVDDQRLTTEPPYGPERGTR